MFRTKELHDYCRRGHIHIETDPKQATFKKSHNGEIFIHSVCEYCKIGVWLTKEQFKPLYREYKKEGI